MSTEWKACQDDLRARYPNLGPTELNKLLNAIWYNEANRKEWMRHYRYQQLQTLKEDPDLKDPPEYNPPAFDGTVTPKKPKGPLGRPPKNPNPKPKPKTVVINDDSSDEEQEDVKPTKVVTAPVKKKNADYYKKKYYKEKMRSSKK